MTNDKYQMANGKSKLPQNFCLSDHLYELFINPLRHPYSRGGMLLSVTERTSYGEDHHISLRSDFSSESVNRPNSETTIIPDPRVVAVRRVLQFGGRDARRAGWIAASGDRVVRRRSRDTVWSRFDSPAFDDSRAAHRRLLSGLVRGSNAHSL